MTTKRENSVIIGLVPVLPASTCRTSYWRTL